MQRLVLLAECLLSILATFPASAQAADAMIHLERAVILAPADLSIPEQKALAMLADEVDQRTQIRWQRVNAWPAGNVPVIVVGQKTALHSLLASVGRKSAFLGAEAKAEGYQIQIDQGQSAPVVSVAGND